MVHKFENAWWFGWIQRAGGHGRDVGGIVGGTAIGVRMAGNWLVGGPTHVEQRGRLAEGARGLTVGNGERRRFLDFMEGQVLFRVVLRRRSVDSGNASILG